MSRCHFNDCRQPPRFRWSWDAAALPDMNVCEEHGAAMLRAGGQVVGLAIESRKKPCPITCPCLCHDMGGGPAHPGQRCSPETAE